jgi:zinc/manganese transport system permease protein
MSVHGVPFLACLVMLSILCYIGIHVLRREIIFIDIALAQIAAVGAIAAHVVFHFHGHSVYSQALALGCTFLAAVFFAVVRRRVNQIPLEAVIGVTYAVSAAAALFLVGVAPGGHVHIQEMLAGSILWATWNDVTWSAGVFAMVGVCFYLFRGPFRIISEDYENAVALGYNTLAWDFLFYALVGIVITVAVRVAGVVVVFTFLIIPATLSVAFASGWTGRLVSAWIAGAVSTALGLLFAARYDFSVGPAIALFLGVALVVIGVLRGLRLARTATAAVWLVSAAVLGAWFAAGSAGLEPARVVDPGGVPSTGEITHSHDYNVEIHTETDSAEFSPELLAAIADTEQLERSFHATSDVEQRCNIACRTMEIDAGAGMSLAIEFLEGDPPLLFRLTVVNKIEEVLGRDIAWDIDRPFGSPENQEVVRSLK